MTNSKVFFAVLLLVTVALGKLNVKDEVYNVTEDTFEEFMDFAKGKNATFYIKFYSRITSSLIFL